MNSPSREQMRDLVIVVIIGFAICLLFGSYQIFDFLNRKAAFDRVQLGMTRQDAVRVLETERVYCGLTDLYLKDAQSCEFADYWYHFRIVTSPETGRVVRKEFSPLRRRHFLNALLE